MSSMKIVTNGVPEIEEYYDDRTKAVKELISNPAAAGTEDFVASNNLANKVQTLVGNTPDVPRNVVVTIADATPSITKGTVEITGIRAYDGLLRKEILDCSDGAGTYTGSVAFAVVTQIKTVGFDVLDGSGDETFKAGYGEKIGLVCTSALKAVYKETADGEDEDVGTVDLVNKTITLTTEPDGEVNYELYYTCAEKG